MYSKTLSIKPQHLVLMANIKDAPFKCLHCKKVFISGNHLKRHEERRHNLKISSIPSEEGKEARIFENANESTIKAVLNATERIEDLLVKLAVRESERKTYNPVEYSSPRKNFEDSLVTSSSFTKENYGQNIKHSEYKLDDSMSQKTDKEIVQLKCNDKSNLDESVSTSCSLSTEKNIENYNYFLNDRTPNKKPNENTQLNYFQKSNLKDIPCYSLTNCEHSLSVNSYTEKEKGIVRVLCHERSKFLDTLCTSYFTDTKNEPNITISKPSLIDDMYTKKLEVKGNLQVNETSEFKAAPSNTKSFTTNENEQNFEISEFLNSNFYEKTEKRIANLSLIEKAECVDVPCSSKASLTNERNEQSFKNSEHFLINSSENNKKKEQTKLLCNERRGHNDIPCTLNPSTKDKNEQSSEIYKYVSDDSSHNKTLKEVVALQFSDKKNIKDSQTSSNSCSNSEHVLNDMSHIKKTNEVDNLQYIPSEFKDIPCTSRSFNNEESIERTEHFSEDTIINNNENVRDKLLSMRSDFEDGLITSNAFTNSDKEQSKENYKCISNDKIHTNKQKELKYDERNYVEESSDNYFYFPGDINLQTTDKSENFSSDSTYDKKTEEKAKLRLNERSDFKDMTFTSCSSTNHKNDEIIENISVNSISSKKQKEIKCKGVKYVEDTPDTYLYFPGEINVQNIEKFEPLSSDSSYDRKRKEKAKFSERSDFEDMPLTSSSSFNDINEQTIENISTKKLKHEGSNAEDTTDSYLYFPGEKNIHKIEHCLDHKKFNKRQNNSINFTGSMVASNCFVTENKQNLKKGENFSYSIGSEKKGKQTKKFILFNKKSKFKGDSLDSISRPNDKNKLNTESYEYTSNDSTLNKKQMITKSQFSEITNSNDSPFAINSSCEKNEKNSENYNYSSNDTKFNKKQKDSLKLKSNERSNFDDTLVTSGCFTSEKIVDVENSKSCLNDRLSYKNEEDIVNMSYNETGDLENTQVTSDSFSSDKSEHCIESSGHISFGSIPFKKSKKITKKTINDLIEDQENKAIWRLTSSVIKSSNYSLDVIDPIYSSNGQDSEENDLFIPQMDDFVEGRPMKKCRSSLKSEIIRKLDCKLESYGVDSGQNTLSDKEMKRIGILMKEERDHIAETIPDYYKLRQLIKDSAYRRFDENLQIHTSVS